MPETVSINDDGDVPGPGLLHDDADPAQHALVPPQPRAQHHHVKTGQPLVYLFYTVFSVCKLRKLIRLYCYNQSLPKTG